MSTGSGAVATSDPRATDIAVEILRAGGNAIDAAVAATFVLYVVEPQTCGVAGDAFLIVAGHGGPPQALDGSGAIPRDLTSDRLREDGLDGVPPRGGRTATVPGALDLLEQALSRFGTMRWPDVIDPALTLAREGFEVRPALANAAMRAAGEIGRDGVLGPLYVPGGTAVAEGSRVRNPALAECLASVATGGAAVMYTGEYGAAIVETVRADGGYLSTSDMAAHRTEAVTPEHVEFRGHRVWELGAPTQGPAVLHTLRDLESSGALDGAVDWSAVLEATRRGMRQAGFDPAAMGPRPSPAKGDTTYLAVVDADGRYASLITSVFGDFGSHLGVPEIGGPVHNRATTLRMLHRMPAPGKPPHTTIPGLVTVGEAPCLALGVAGGIMQPQTQVQLLVRILSERLDLQTAIDAPRFKICFGGDVALEPRHPLAATLPAALDKDPGPEGFGNAQAAGTPLGRLDVAADSRRGGTALLA